MWNTIDEKDIDWTPGLYTYFGQGDNIEHNYDYYYDCVISTADMGGTK